MKLSLGQAAEVRLGRQRSPQFASGDSMVPYLRSANVTDGELNLADVKTMNFTPFEQSMFGLEEGDVLLTEGSGSRDTVGTSAVWRGEIDGVVCFQNTLLRLRPRQGITDGRYLSWWARHARASGQIAAVSTGANILHIGAEGLKHLRVDVPAIEVQRRIADFLDDRVARIDKIIAARRRQIDLTSMVRERKIMDTLLGSDFKLLESPPWITACRPSASVESLSSHWLVIDCKHRTPRYEDAGYPVVSPGDVTKGRLKLSRATRFVNELDYRDLADDLRRCLHGDLVYSRNASAGTAAYVDTQEPFTMGQDVCRITSADQSQLYLSYCLNYLTEPQLDTLRIGATFTRINVAHIKSLRVPMRPVAAQGRIAALCDQVEDATKQAMAGLEHSIALFTEYKQSLITAAVTGELDVTTARKDIPG